MAKKRPFDPMGSGYDMETAKESGQKPIYNPEDKKMHWGSLDPRTGMVLKGRTHPTWRLHEQVEANRESRQEFKKGRYYTVPDPKLQIDEKKLQLKQRYIDSITPKPRG